MKNTKFVEEAKLHPARIYTRPQDVLRDRRLNDVDRLEILTVWEREARSAESAQAAPQGRLGDIVQARQEVEDRLPSAAGQQPPQPSRH
ncbi:MAG TPA: hypothetical protein VGM17_09445 [Rhizomicrobium sp.]|jgi:hypothetical protein